MMSRYILPPWKQWVGKVNCDARMAHLIVCYELYPYEHKVPPNSLQDIADHFLNDKSENHTSLNSFICPMSNTKPGDPNKVDDWSDFVLCTLDCPTDPNLASEQILYCRYHLSNGIANIWYLNDHRGRRSTFHINNASTEEKALLKKLTEKDSNTGFKVDAIANTNKPTSF